MHSTRRRQLLQSGLSLAAAAALPGPLWAAMGPNDKFDLLVRNANTLDAGTGLSGMRDIGIRYGLIEAIEASIAPERAQRVMDAGGKLSRPA